MDNEQDGISYDEIEKVVEQLVRVKSHQSVFDCWEIDDIAQEIRIICLNALKHYDGARVIDGKLINYFGRCVDYRLQNLKRDKYIRFTSYFTKDQIAFAESNPESDLGQKYAKFKESINRRKKVKHPVPIDSVGENHFKFTCVEDVEVNDLRNYLVNNIPERLRGALISMMDGDTKSVEPSLREAVRNFVEEKLGPNCL